MGKRVAVVTGGGGGLGTAICRKLAQDGCKVVAVDLANSEERIAAFREATNDLDIGFEPLDVRDFDACGTLVKNVEAEHGSLDILVNVDGVFNLCRHAVDGMATRGFGRIVNISSVNGQTGQFGQTNYAAAKAGMHGITMSLAREGARKGVTVNSVSPGYCATAMVMALRDEIRANIVANVPVGRLGEPTEIARTVSFLAADDAGFITGANIPVNGGLFMSF